MIDVEPFDCEPGPTVLCLGEGGRFEVRVRWRDFEGGEGPGTRVEEAESVDSGLLWFFDADNWEMLLKVLDGCNANGHHWVFLAAVTNVEYTVTVTDSVAGRQRSYENPLGRSSPAITDTEAFATCP